MDNTLEKLMEAISKLVNEDNRPWTEKRDYILGNISGDEETALFEFLAWFDEPEPKDSEDLPREKAA